MINEEYNKWLILYFDMQSINLQFNCNDIASSLKAQRDKIKQFCIDCLTGVKHQADSFLFDTKPKIVFTSSSWCSDVFSLTETESYYKQQSPNLV